jgi:Asp-tRNA(Asn)/Glu-tRNA(Gln) amidotransferase A subunit family amidase
MLQVMAASDPADPVTAGHPHPDYRAALKPGALKAKRIGVLRVLFGDKPEHQAVNQVMAGALAAMRRQGAILVELNVPALDSDTLNADNDVQKYELKSVMDAYLASIPNPPKKTVADIVASGQFNHPALEKLLATALSYQDGLAEPDYKLRLQRDAETRALLARVMDDNRLDAIVYPLQKRLVVPVTELNQADRNGILAAVTGYPAITVPAGFSQPTEDAPNGVPVGMDILGRPFSESKLLSIACGFEQATHVRRPPQSTPKLPTER